MVRGERVDEKGTMTDWVFLLPKGWQLLQRWGDYGFACSEVGGGLRVLVDCEEKADGKRWLHVSYSRKGWTPSHADTCKVRDAFIGSNRYCYAVFPPSGRYVNIHPHCLHLWALWEGDDGRVLPEFSEILPGIGVSV